MYHTLSGRERIIEGVFAILKNNNIYFSILLIYLTGYNLFEGTV